MVKKTKKPAKKVSPKKKAKPVEKKGRCPSNKGKQSKVRKLIELAKQKIKKLKR